MSPADLLENNRTWARSTLAADPDYFARLERQQSPQFLWIGCSDSRVPANQITGLAPGEVFVHRNIANVVVHTDLNCLSVIQFGVDILKIRHIIVCGHYGCNGVHAAELAGHAREDERHRRLCELNVHEQVGNISQCTAVQEAWERGQPLEVHGWIYDLKDGLIRNLNCTRKE